MNMAITNYQDQEIDYQVDIGRRGTKQKPARQRRISYSRTNRPVVMHNGIHRRRNKRFSW